MSSRTQSKLVIAVGLALLPAGAWAAQSRGPSEPAFESGLVPVDRATYVKLPSVRRHRGFYKASVDLSSRFPKPGYQGQQGTCAAFSTTYAARSFLRSNQLGRPPTSDGEVPSPEYVYTRARGEAGDCRNGISMVQALEILKSEGVVPLSDFPYDDAHCLMRPPEALKDKAALLRIGGWRAVQRKTPGDWRTPIVLDDVKAQLSQGLPVVFSMQVSPEFKKLQPGQVWKGETGSVWHAMALVGYDEARQAVRVMNSWGTWWADGGYAWIDYATFQRDAGEAYVLEPGSVDQIPGQPVVAKPLEPSPAPVDVEPQIAALLQKTDCAALQLTKENGRRVVTGFGGLSPDLVKTRTAATALDPRLEWRVATHPWPQCEAELTLAKVYDPARVQLHVSDAAGKPLPGDPIGLAHGDEFAIDLETKADRPFVHVVYIQADGSAVELYRGTPKQDASGRLRMVVGADGPKGVRFRVDTPYGNESLIAVASKGPLFADELKGAVTEREFLTLLRAKLVAAAKASRPVSASIVRMHSAENAKLRTAAAGL